MYVFKQVFCFSVAITVSFAAFLAHADFYPLKTSLDANFEGHFSFTSQKEASWYSIAHRDASLKSSVGVYAELEFPKTGQPPYPLVAIVHGTDGASPFYKKYVEYFKSQGYATLFIDAFSPRGFPLSVGNHTEAVSSVTIAQDFFRAFDVVKTHPKVDMSRVSAVGFSKGGTAVLWMAEEKFRSLYARDGFKLRAIVAFYPGCQVQLQEVQSAGSPVLMLMGGDDTYVGAKPCEPTIAAMRNVGMDVTAVVYPGAVHGFDAGYPPRVLPDFDMSYLNCRFVDLPDGRMKDVLRDKIMTSNEDVHESFNQCGTKGVTMGRNENAARQALKAMTDFIAKNTGVRRPSGVGTPEKATSPSGSNSKPGH